MHDHLTTAEVHEHIARLERALRQPIGMAYGPADHASDRRELESLQDTLDSRQGYVR